MSAEQSQMFPMEQTTWRDYRRDPVPHIRHLSVLEQIKHCNARFCWKHRDEICPTAHKHDNGYVGSITWSTWFAIRYGETIYDFQKRHEKAAASPTKTAAARR